MSETIVGSLVEHGDLHTLMTTNGTHHINFSLLPADDPGCAYPARIELSASGQPIVLFEGDTKYTPWSNYLDLVNGGGYQVRIDDLFNGNPVEQVLAQLKPKPKKRAVQIEAPASREDEYVDYAALIADELQNRFANHDKSSDWRHQPEAMLALSDAILNNNDRPDWYGIVAATGTGKTHMQQMLLETAQAVGAKHCIYVTSNIDLVPKTQRDFDKHGYQRREAHFYTRKTKIHPDTDIIYTLYDSLPTLLDEMKSRGITPPLIIADEGDNLRMRRGKVLDHELLQNESMLVTFTATPGITPGQRLVDLDIPTIYNFDINEGMQRDVLSHARIYRYFHDRTKMSDTDAILNIAPIRFMDPKTGELKQTLIQASSIDEANELYFKLMSDPMYSEVRHRIAIAHSRTNSEVPEDYQHAVANEFVWQLDDAVQGLNNQTVDWLIVVNKGIVGIDAPTLEVVYKRMMMSDTKPYQAIGRAARKNPFNPDATFDIVTSYPVPNPEAMGYPTELLLFGLKEYEPGCVYRGNAADYNRQIAVARAQNRVEEDETPDGLALIRYG
ncbi:DEAD/DEAH box helicase family protein, partial [Candidatus Dojkabacteria bacterium]|nr:DEAD/DEAH box helicase family protein [Candidatus Dojkabacteria bacterium]